MFNFQFLGVLCIVPFASMGLALGLRDGWVSPIILWASAVLLVWAFIRYQGNLALQAIAALSFYAVAFEGLLSPHDGAFGGIWFTFTILYACLQTLAYYLYSVLFSQTPLHIALLPGAAVVFEYLRYWLARLYDGSGMTLCSLGQVFTENRVLIQIAELTGVWGLTFLLVLTAVVLAIWLIQNLPRSFKVCYSLSALLVIVFVAGFGTVRLHQLDSKTTTTATVPVAVVPFAASEAVRSIQAYYSNADLPSLASHASTGSRLTFLLPETCMIWNTRDAKQMAPEQTELIELSKQHAVNLILGAAIPEEPHAFRNAYIALHKGQIIEQHDKYRLVPFVESKPWVTKMFARLGWLPGVSHQGVIADGTSGVIEDEDGLISHLYTCVCYDIYFSETFFQRPDKQDYVILCMLDESLDADGIFQAISWGQSKLRAVEFRKPVVRSSKNGRSGALSHTGDTVDAVYSDFGFSIYHVTTHGSYDTLFSKWGNWFPVLMASLLAGIAMQQGLVRAVCKPVYC